MKAQPTVGVIVDENEKRLGQRCGEPRLLAQFAKRRIARFLVVFDLAAGKLPRAPEVLLVGATGDEDQAPSRDDRERDVEAVDGVGDQAGAPAAPGL